METSSSNDIITTARGELPPETQEKIKALESDVEKTILDTSVQMSKNAQDFFLEYEGRAKDVPRAILIFRSLIRPIVTSFFAFVLMIFFGIDFWRILHGRTLIITRLPEQFWVLSMIIFGFWFGGRSGERIFHSKNH